MNSNNDLTLDEKLKLLYECSNLEELKDFFDNHVSSIDGKDVISDFDMFLESLEAKTTSEWREEGLKVGVVKLTTYIEPYSPEQFIMTIARVIIDDEGNVIKDKNDERVQRVMDRHNTKIVVKR